MGACVVCCQPSAAWSVSCFSCTSLVSVATSCALALREQRLGGGEVGLGVDDPLVGRRPGRGIRRAARDRRTRRGWSQLCGLLGVGGLRLVGAWWRGSRRSSRGPGCSAPGARPCPDATPQAGIGVPGSAVGDDLRELRAVSNAAARAAGSAPPTTPAAAGSTAGVCGRVDGLRSGRSGDRRSSPRRSRRRHRRRRRGSSRTAATSCCRTPSTARWRTASRRARPIARGTRRWPPPSPGTAPR